MNVTIQQNISLPFCQNPLSGTVVKLAETLFTSESQRLNFTIGNTDDEKNDMKVKKDGGYKCIHLSIDQFITTIERILEKENYLGNKKFIDVGCGVGQKVFLAKSLFNLDAHGLELREPFVKRANEILNWSKYNRYNNEPKKVFEANALTFDKYNEFDFIYFYCPIADKELQIKLEKQIAQNAKKGAVVIGFLSQYFSEIYEISEKEENIKELNKLGWKMLGNNYWKKVK